MKITKPYNNNLFQMSDSLPTNGKLGQLCYVTSEDKYYVYKSTGWSALGGGGGASTFIGLTDTFSSYSGRERSILYVNDSGDAITSTTKMHIEDGVGYNKLWFKGMITSLSPVEDSSARFNDMLGGNRMFNAEIILHNTNFDSTTYSNYYSKVRTAGTVDISTEISGYKSIILLDSDSGEVYAFLAEGDAAPAMGTTAAYKVKGNWHAGLDTSGSGVGVDITGKNHNHIENMYNGIWYFHSSITVSSSSPATIPSDGFTITGQPASGFTGTATLNNSPVSGDPTYWMIVYVGGHQGYLPVWVP